LQYVLLFLEGIITFISPCLLPMLPIYISYFAAGESDKRRAIANSLGFVAGFTLVFAALGAFAGTLGKLLTGYMPYINVISGAFVILLGINFTGLINIGFLNRTVARKANVADLTFLSSAIFGVVFSIGWTPCVGAFLGSALMLASQRGSAVQGVLMLLCYSLGLGVPFLISALLIERLKTAFGYIKRHYKVINAVSGLFLVVIGVLMMTGMMGRFLSLLTF